MEQQPDEIYADVLMLQRNTLKTIIMDITTLIELTEKSKYQLSMVKAKQPGSPGRYDELEDALGQMLEAFRAWKRQTEMSIKSTEKAIETLGYVIEDQT